VLARPEGLGLLAPLLALFAVLTVILAGLVGWRALRRPSTRLVVLLTEFAANTPEDRSWSMRQQEALVERLEEAPDLREIVEIRVLPAAVSRQQAEVLLEETPARAVVFGSVRAATDTARWKAELLIRWRGEVAEPLHIEPDGTAEYFDRKITIPPHHESLIDAQQPLSRLADERFESDHADRIEGTLLVVAASYLLSAEPPETEPDEDEPENEREWARRALDAFERYRLRASLQTRAMATISRAVLSPTPAAALDLLEEAGGADADHADLWNFATMVNALADVRDSAWATRQLVLARRAVTVGPSPVARYNLGQALMVNGHPHEALAQFDRIADDPLYADRFHLHFGRGVIAYNIRRFETARDSYQRATQLRTHARAHLYLADALRATGDEDEAHKHYREALLIEPTLVPAHRGYWFSRPEDDPEIRRTLLFDRIANPLINVTGKGKPWRRRLVRPILWRMLRWQHRRHPEDSRVHFMLGAYALLRGDYEVAEERLRFALELNPADLEAQARLAVVRAFMGDLDETEFLVREIRDAPRLPTAPGAHSPVPQDSASARLWMLAVPFFDEPRLETRPHADELHSLLEDCFGGAVREELAQ
jgi:tetratricopeptide (TPR) repeat protein